MNRSPALLKALAHAVAERLTFAAFRVPGRPVQLLVQRQPDIEAIDGALLLELNQVFLLAPFALDPEHIPFIRADVELAFVEIDPDVAVLNECVGSRNASDRTQPATDRAAYIGSVEAAKRLFASTELEKVVLSRVARSAVQATDLPGLFIDRTHRDQEAFVALVHTPEHGFWIGASPERLAHAEEGHVTVDALAGTWAGDQAPELAGAWGTKELDEQELVTRHVMRTFVDQGLQNITTRGPEVLHAGPVAHLHTTLEADLGDRLLGDLVLALHPTPAVCGTPRHAAQEAIARLEGHDRALYAGFWGPWNAEGITDLYVNLRCLRVHDQAAECFVGAGITAASTAEAEWAETERKAGVWSPAIA